MGKLIVGSLSGKNDSSKIQFKKWLSIKKNEIMSSAATWMDVDSVMLSEVSQTEKEEYYMISFICGI